jgi:hypothetical protein
MTTSRDNGTFRLETLPEQLWDMARMALELWADDQTIRRWVRERRLSGPTLRRGGRAYWDPTHVHFFRRQRLRRIGAEMREAVGAATPAASGASQTNFAKRKANEGGI